MKCHQYWESSKGETSMYDNFSVKTTEVDADEDCTVASLEIKNLKVRKCAEVLNFSDKFRRFQTDETRNVSHWQFTSWPDYGVPSSAIAMLKFLQRVREKQAEMVTAMGDTWAGHPRGPPLVVHCSAGIGRTGEQ